IHNRDEAAAAFTAAKAQLQDGQDLPGVADAVSRDPDVAMLRQKVMGLDDTLEQLSDLGEKHHRRQQFQQQREAAQRKLEDSSATVRATQTATLIERLRSMSEQTDAQAKQIDERV